jgi:hypothetical protein
MTMSFQRDEVIEVEIRFIGRRRAGKFQKKIGLPSNIVDVEGRTIQRCWCGR